MEECIYISGILTYRGNIYPFVSCEPQDDTWVQVNLSNNGGIMTISLQAGFTMINSELQETQAQLMATLNDNA